MRCYPLLTMISLIGFLVVSGVSQRALGGYQDLGSVVRDAFGVPRIESPNEAGAWRLAGKAIAEDRMWQLELSRRLARGQLAEALGREYLDSDREVLREAFTDRELEEQLARLPVRLREAFDAYALGINDFIQTGKLPVEYAAAGFEPRPWTRVDSAAIAIRLLRTFGRGGAGELRNLALLSLLKTRPNLKGRELDVVDDFAWFNDRRAPTTLPAKEDTWDFPADVPKPRPVTRSETLAQLATLPSVSLLELLPAVRLAERQSSTLVAESLGLPFKSGSYAVVVDAKHSKSGQAILLSAPQMGFQIPSIIAEISVKTDGWSATGMCVPGIPGITIGHNVNLAWGLTSGVADTDDIVVAPKDAVRETHSWVVNVKGGNPVTVVQKRTADGPVVLETKTHVFARRMSYWGREFESFISTDGLMRAKSADDVEATMASATMSFNLFYATRAGEIGYVYAGRVPLRKPGVDPRFPTLEVPWAGVLTTKDLPRIRNPKRGWLANWNNKPAREFPNGDTPVWGRVFRNQVLEAQLKGPTLSVADVERAAWTIARRSDTFDGYERWLRKAGGGKLQGYDGWNLAGSRAASAYRQFVAALPEAVFGEAVGNLGGADNLREVAQQSLILEVLDGRTKFPFLGKRKPLDVIQKTLAGVSDDPAPYVPGSIRVPGESPIPYSSRGSFIQIVTFGVNGVDGRSVIPPGQSESGAHALDQVPLARSWTFKPMWKP